MKIWSRISKPSKRIRVLLTAFLVLLVPSIALAADSEFARDLYEAITWILDFLAWAWIIPASIAGKALTNDIVYGEFFHFSRYLWKVWQFMRTLAMFTVGIIFMAGLVSYIMGRGDPSKFIKLVGKVAACAILIPMSWWLIAVLVDFSVVMTATVSSIPLQIIQEQWNEIQVDFKIPKRIDVDDGRFFDRQNNASADNYKTLELEDIMPQADSVAGPLIFLGASVIRIQELVYLPDGIDDNDKGMALGSLLKIFIMVMFFVPILVLMVVNVIRIFYIRLWICFAPFIVITNVFGNADKLLGSWSDKFSIYNILGLIFQPPVIVGLMSLGLILIIGVYDVLMGTQDHNRDELAKIHFYVTGSAQDEAILGPPELAEIRVKGQLASDLGGEVGGALGTLIIVFFVIMVLWALVKAGFATAKLTSSTAQSIYSGSSNYMKSQRRLPGGHSLAGLEQAKRDIQAKAAAGGQATAESEHIVDSFRGASKGIKESDFTKVIEKMGQAAKPEDKAAAFWNGARQVGDKKKIQGKSRVFKNNVQKWLTNGGGLQYLTDKGVISEDERKAYSGKNIANIWSNENFNTFVDHIMRTGWSDEAVKKYNKGRKVTSIDNKTYGAT